MRHIAPDGRRRRKPVCATIEIEGDAVRLRRFVVDLERQAPPLAVIERVRTAEIPTRHDGAFVIADSATAHRRHVLVPPDAATCDE